MEGEAGAGLTEVDCFPPDDNCYCWPGGAAGAGAGSEVPGCT